MPTFHRIRDFDRVFACSQSKKMRDPARASWFACPISWEGRGFMALMEHPEGMSLFGAYILIVQVAARCQRPGDLYSGGRPMTPEDVARKVRGDKETIRRAFEVLSSEPFQWIEQIDADAASLPPVDTQSTAGRSPVDGSGTPSPTTGQENRQDKTVDRTEREERAQPEDESLFPKNGLPFRLSAHLRAKSARLYRLTPGVLTATVLLADRFNRMPEDVLFAAADDFAAAANAGEDFATSIPKALHTYVGRAYNEWARQQAFEARNPPSPKGGSPHPRKTNGPAADWDSYDPASMAPAGS